MRFKPHMRPIFAHTRSYAMSLLLLIIVANVANVVAIPLSSYRERVHSSIIILDSLKSIGEDTDEVSREEVIAMKLDEVRLLLPPLETVESNGPSLEIDNTWLEKALLQYQELYSSTEERNDLLSQTTERLVALEKALADQETNEVKPSGTRDDSKSRMSTILRRDEYAKKAAEGNALSRVLRRFFAWLRSLFPNAPQADPERAGVLSRIAQILVVGLALAVIAFVMWKLWPRIWRSNPLSKKREKREARVVLGERLEPDQSSVDLLAEAEALARSGNLREAIRKGYVALLCELGDRKVIGLAGHKTNRDYLRSVRSQDHLYREMQVLTNSYESHWYGFVPASMDDWNLFRTRYHQALGQG